MKKKTNYLILLLTLILMVGCTEVEDTSVSHNETVSQEESTVDTEENNEQEEPTTTVTDDSVEEESVEEPSVEEQPVTEENTAQSNDNLFEGYKLIEVDACNTSGYRQAKVVVDIGYGDREYWAFTNEYGQLVRVIADEIILQNDNTESVTSQGRYCYDEAKVPGVESSVLDEGHIIADSLGGVSNAYNITPQNSTLNRHGYQAYMEDAIRKAGGATNFEAIITYPNTSTHIPSSYQYTYTIKGKTVVDKYDNVNPDEVNAASGLTGNTSSNANQTNTNTSTVNKTGDLSSVDTNGNGQVTIKEAKDAGYSMPITRDHWLYPYMDDRDGDGMVGE